MTNLTNAAAVDYLVLVRISYFAGIIDWSECLSRLATLAGLCAPTDPVHQYVSRVLRLEEYEGGDEWGEVDSSSFSDGSSHERANAPKKSEDDDDFRLFFYPASNTGLSNWIFHRYDADFHPSVPHSHDQNRKLDAYQGWIYVASRQVSRESRNKIVALWNDSAFRGFARHAINYYLTHHPSYTGWRVPNPRRLRRRRP